jgi:subfamily B ATP-binding cassette protein HlyB/CyaB
LDSDSIQEIPSLYRQVSESMEKKTGLDDGVFEAEGQEGEDPGEVSLNEVFSDEAVVRKRPFRIRYPFVYQHDEMDCGSACLSMVSKYWGNDLSLQFWRQRVQTGKNGTSLFDLLAAAEKFGFITHPVSVESIAMIGEGDILPAIVLRNSHYVVVYRVTSKQVIVGDPSVGIRKMSHEEFDEGFQKAVLLLRPIDRFFENRSEKSEYGHYFELFFKFKKELAIVLLVSILIIVFDLVSPFLFQLIYDDVLVNKDGNLLAFVLIAALTASAATSVLGFIKMKYVIYISSKFDFIASSAFFRKLFSLPYRFIAERHIGDFTHRVSELQRLRLFLTNQILGIVLDLLTLGVFAVALYLFSPTILLISLGMSAVLVLISVLFSRRMINAFQESFLKGSEQDSAVTEALKGISTIKTTNCEIGFRWNLEGYIAKSLKARNDFSHLSISLDAISGFVHESFILLLLGFAAYLALTGKFTPGQVISASMLVGNIMRPFSNLAHSWSGIQEAKATAQRLNDVFLMGSEVKKLMNEGDMLEHFRGEIEFRNVWFRYGGESSEWVLKNVSFRIPAGESVALVGRSGSGKSTIGLLLGGLYAPSEGQILIDGRELGDYDTSWIRKRMGFILQEPSLFHGTIAQNIALGEVEIDPVRLRQVATQANAMEFIEKNPLKFDFLLTHGGLGLSAGEKQRIAFSRALYNDPHILILDEATSAMDGISEKAVIHSLREGRRTMINIAHRLSTAIASDSLIILDQGEVVGSGTHSELARQNELYRRLFNIDEMRTFYIP